MRWEDLNELRKKRQRNPDNLIPRLPRALAMKYKFDQHTDTYFHNLGSHGNPNTLTVKSEKSSLWINCYTGCPKIRSMEDINDFMTQQNMNICTDQNTKLQSFFHFFLTKNAHFSGLFCCWRKNYKILQGFWC